MCAEARKPRLRRDLDCVRLVKIESVFLTLVGAIFLDWLVREAPCQLADIAVAERPQRFLERGNASASRVAEEGGGSPYGVVLRWTAAVPRSIRLQEEGLCDGIAGEPLDEAHELRGAQAVLEAVEVALGRTGAGAAAAVAGRGSRVGGRGSRDDRDDLQSWSWRPG